MASWSGVAVAVVLTAALTLSSCTPSIGDRCVLSTDCSTRGDRLCDTSQPDGYCTQFNCAKDSCPDEAACILFNAAVPGCGYDDRSGGYGARTARAFCIASCGRDTDCRPGYICADPRVAPWLGLPQDSNQNKRTCMVAPAASDVDAGRDAAISSQPEPAVCNAVGPSVPAIDASRPRLPEDATVTPQLDAGKDADADAGDAADGD